MQVELWRDGRVESLSATLDEPAFRKKIAAGRVVVSCDGEDCEDSGEHPSVFFFQHGDGAGTFDCGLDDEGNAVDCAVEVRCANDTCTCTVNGEEKLCDELDGVKTIRLRKKVLSQEQ